MKHFDISPSLVKDNVERIDVRKVSLEEFREKYETPYVPVVLTHVQDNWLAEQKWTLEV